jgi:Mrp family chromosome partitioning ATPase
MESLSNESTPRERLARLLTLTRRTRMFWRSALVILAMGLAVSFALAWNAKRAWRSETTVGYLDSIRTNKDGENASTRAARLGPKLKDLVYARPRLAEVIDEFHLFPEKTAKSMVEAEDEMQNAIGFHARASDTFVISFTYEDPVVAQKVAARLADNMIEDYNKENLTGATLTRDFLNKKRAEASRRVDDASRGLASFLALHPQFQWGLNDSPYAATAPVPGPRAPIAAPAPARPRPGDPVLGRLESDLARVEAELTPASARVAAPPTSGEPLKQRDAAAANLTAAEAALAEKLTVVTPAHPDAVAAQARVNAARAALGAAETGLHAKAAPVATDNNELAPDTKARLERERTQLRARMAARRRELSGAAPSDVPAPAPAPASTGTEKSAQQDVVDLETEWHRLKLDLDRARDELHNVELTAQAADISADAVEKKSQSEMRILDPAYRPTKPDKGKGRVFLIGAVIALFIALGYAGTRVLLNDTVLDAGDVLALGGPQPLVALPLMAMTKPPRQREMARRSQPEVVLARDEVDEPENASRVVVPAAPMSETVRQLPAPRNLRARQATMRWGTRIPVEGGAVAVDAYALDVEPEPPRAALAVVPSRIFAIGGDEPPRRPPEVHVVGADLDPHGPGAFALLNDATPELLAALRVLRHRLDQRRAGSSCVVTVVSPGQGEGKSTLAARLAMTLGESDRARVVLVEGNLEHPRVAKTLGISLPAEVGLSHQVHQRMLGNKAPWGVIKLGPSLSTLAEPEVASYPGVVHATHFLDALRALRARYDYVVVDGPSVLGSGDANVLEEVSDVVLVVARAAKTRASALAIAEQQLGESKILGVVLNGVAARRAKSARLQPS